MDAAQQRRERALQEARARIRKAIEERAAVLRVAREHAALRAARASSQAPPRYDDVYWDGVAWLDEISEG